jgi:hypothetical protein
MPTILKISRTLDTPFSPLWLLLITFHNLFNIPDPCPASEVVNIHHYIIHDCWEYTIEYHAFWLVQSVIADVNWIMMRTQIVLLNGDIARVGVRQGETEWARIWQEKGGLTIHWNENQVREYIWVIALPMSISNMLGAGPEQRDGLIDHCVTRNHHEAFNCLLSTWYVEQKIFLTGLNLKAVLQKFTQCGLESWMNRIRNTTPKKWKFIHVGMHFIALMHLLVFLMLCWCRRQWRGNLRSQVLTDNFMLQHLDRLPWLPIALYYCLSGSQGFSEDGWSKQSLVIPVSLAWGKWIDISNTNINFRYDHCLSRKCYKHRIGSNVSKYPASGADLNNKTESVRFQTCPKPRLLNSLGITPGPIMVNAPVLPGLTRAVGFNLKCTSSSFTFMVVFKYANDKRKIRSFTGDGLFSTYWQPYWAQRTESQALPHS